METLLRRYAKIFDYFSSKYYFENHLQKIPSQRLSEVWTDMDFQIKRTFALNQVLDVEYNDITDFDFFSNLGYLAEVDIYKQLDELKNQDGVLDGMSRASIYSSYPFKQEEHFYNTLIRDAIEISFEKLYVHVILHLSRKNYLDFDKSLLHIQFILNHSTAIKEYIDKELIKNQNSSINFYINYFYGTLSEKNKILVRKVVEFVHMAISKRYACLFIDTDEIVIKQKKDIVDMLNFLGLPFEIFEISQIIIFNKRKLIKIYKNGQTKIRGFPELNEKQMKLLGLAE